LKSKRATDVAMQILDIFLLFGAPNILQSDNGAEFTVSIISNCFHASMLRSYLLYLRLLAQHFLGFVGVSASHERLCTLAINPLIEI
jgi:hypothetical protein